MIDEKIKATVQKIFNQVRAECPRSYTKHNLHTDPNKEAILATQLNKIFETYGQAIATQFQHLYEAANPALSFLFAQMSNAVVEKTFHHGSCHAQAAYALIELAKHQILNVSLMWSKTDNPTTEHYYLAVLDAVTYSRMQQTPPKFVYIENTSTRLPPDSLFFDTWSEQLIEFKQLAQKNDQLKAIPKTRQFFFKPFSCLFTDPINLFETIVKCLEEYQTRLSSIRAIKEPLPTTITALFSADDPAFQEEMVLLHDPEACLAKLSKCIAEYKRSFQTQLDALKQEQATAKKDLVLVSTTSSFFKNNPPARWGTYAPEKLIGGRYAGHDVRFFTIKGPVTGDTVADTASKLADHLTKLGFHAEQKEAKGNPSIVVDLTESTLTPIKN